MADPCYVIISSQTFKELESKVNVKIDEGYNPIGGVCSYSGGLAQALVISDENMRLVREQKREKIREIRKEESKLSRCRKIYEMYKHLKGVEFVCPICSEKAKKSGISVDFCTHADFFNVSEWMTIDGKTKH